MDETEHERIEVHGEPALSAPLGEWEQWLRRLPLLPLPDEQRRELESFAKQIINGRAPGRHRDVPPL